MCIKEASEAISPAVVVGLLVVLMSKHFLTLMSNTGISCLNLIITVMD